MSLIQGTPEENPLEEDCQYVCRKCSKDCFEDEFQPERHADNLIDVVDRLSNLGPFKSMISMAVDDNDDFVDLLTELKTEIRNLKNQFSIVSQQIKALSIIAAQKSSRKPTKEYVSTQISEMDKTDFIQMNQAEIKTKEVDLPDNTATPVPNIKLNPDNTIKVGKHTECVKNDITVKLINEKKKLSTDNVPYVKTFEIQETFPAVTMQVFKNKSTIPSLKKNIAKENQESELTIQAPLLSKIHYKSTTSSSSGRSSISSTIGQSTSTTKRKFTFDDLTPKNKELLKLAKLRAGAYPNAMAFFKENQIFVRRNASCPSERIYNKEDILKKMSW